MKVLIVDDNPNSAKRIEAILSGAPDILVFTVDDYVVAHKFGDFVTDIDVALIDLDLSGEAEKDLDDPAYLGFAVCQKYSALPNTAVIGYSRSFVTSSTEVEVLKQKFREMGADLVLALKDLTQSPISELRLRFEDAKKQKVANGGTDAKRTKVFVGSSVEGLDVARAIQNDLQHDYDIEVWNNTAFGLGQTTIESLEAAIREYKFSIFVLTPDDVRVSREVESKTPRDNVIFEAGLFIGSIGRSRTFLVKPNLKELSLPSDLHGLNCATYNLKFENLIASIGPVCTEIREAVRKIEANDL